VSTLIITPSTQASVTITPPDQSSLVLSISGVGIQGPKGDPGDVAGAADFLRAINRLSEFDTPEAKAAARANLDLQYIDGGTFN